MIRLIPILILLMPSLALAWSGHGHRIVAELAEQQLDPAQRALLQPLLEAVDAGSLAEVSTWADEVRGTEVWRHSARWHFVNFADLGCRYEPEVYCPDGDCIIDAINAQAARLGDASLSMEERGIALKFLVHFVGDIHQPFHAGLAEDLGGNRFQLRYRNEGRNLHSLWDGPILQSLEPDWRAYVDRLSPRMHAMPAGVALDGGPLDWALESCRAIGERGLYPQRGRPVPASYLEAHRPFAEQRVLQAAHRLARFIGEHLPERTTTPPSL